MGWKNCGVDSQVRPIGYGFEGTCDHPGCDCVIDRGVSFACGGMHGEDVYSCEKYFCDEHLYYTVTPNGEVQQLCSECAELIEKEHNEI